MRVCSSFCGIGGIDLAFTQAGHKIVWANDINKYACMTYRHNFPESVLVEGDIRPISIYLRQGSLANRFRFAETKKAFRTNEEIYSSKSEK